MKRIDLTSEYEFLRDEPRSKLIHDSENVRLVLFCLEPGQEIPPHQAPSEASMFIVEGEGKFLDDGENPEAAGGALAIFSPEEPHGFWAGKRTVILAAITPRP